jgi:hypothetical protein
VQKASENGDHQDSFSQRQWLIVRENQGPSLFPILIRLRRPSGFFVNVKYKFILKLIHLNSRKQKNRRQHQADKGGLLIIEFSPTVRSNSFVISKKLHIVKGKYEL